MVEVYFSIGYFPDAGYLIKTDCKGAYIGSQEGIDERQEVWYIPELNFLEDRIVNSMKLGNWICSKGTLYVDQDWGSQR